MSPPPRWSCAVTTDDMEVVSHKLPKAHAQSPGPSSYSRAIHILGCYLMVNRVAGCQSPAGRTPLLGLGRLPFPVWSGWFKLPGVCQGNIPCVLCVGVAQVVVCVGVCGGCGVGVGMWDCGPMVELCAWALFVGGRLHPLVSRA